MKMVIFDMSTPEMDDGVVTEHFRCDCGHEWQREMEDGLIAVGCPGCKRQHLTNLGRMVLRIMKRASTTKNRTSK
jgi:hypothetical protein